MRWFIGLFVSLFGAIKAWYRGLPDQRRAALRSAWQSVLGTLGLFLIAAFSVAVDLLNGGTVEDAVTELSNLTRVAIIAIIGVLTGLISFFMNRPGAKNAATYGDP